MASRVDGVERFEIGRMLQRAFGAIGRQVIKYFGLALILAGIPQLIASIWRLQAAADGQPLDGASVTAAIVGGLLAFAGGILLQAAVTRATVIDLSGERPQFGSCLTAALAMVLPLIGLTLVVGFAVGVATLLLIVPGIMLYTAWSVAVPAYVQERIGVFDSLGRSAALTKGARWKIFALLLVCWIAAVMLQAPLGFAAGVTDTARRGFNPIAILLSTAVSAATSMVIATIQATIYVELRDVKEGASASDLESIFS